MKANPEKEYFELAKEIEKQDEELLELLNTKFDDQGNPINEDDEDDESIISISMPRIVKADVQEAAPISPKRKRRIVPFVLYLIISLIFFGYAFYTDQILNDFQVFPVIMGGIFLIVGIIIL